MVSLLLTYLSFCTIQLYGNPKRDDPGYLLQLHGHLTLASYVTRENIANY
jgi:hypothetical protein